MRQQLHLLRTPHTRLGGGGGLVNFEPEHSIPITCSLKILFVSLIDFHLYEKFTI